MFVRKFELCEGLREKAFIIDLPQARVLLNDTRDIPWIFLVPRVAEVSQILDLSFEDQIKLMKEINFCSNIMKENFSCDRLNIATIGNKTPQLHIHIICRSTNDPYWPETVWQYSCEKMTDMDLMVRVLLLRRIFEQQICNL